MFPEVVEVIPGSPAARAGLRREDLIIDVGGSPVVDASDLQRLMVTEAIGRPCRCVPSAAASCSS